MKATQAGWVLPSVMALLLMVSLTAWTQARQLWLQEQVLKLEDQRVRHRYLAEAVTRMALSDIWAQTRSKEGMFFPTTKAERDALRARLGTAPCREGICLPNNTNNDALPTPNLADWLDRIDQAQNVSASALPDPQLQACYWVEVWVSADDASDSTSESAPPRFYYRITSLVWGGMTGARAAVQAVWQRDAAASDAALHPGVPAGRWLSWHGLTP